MVHGVSDEDSGISDHLVIILLLVIGFNYSTFFVRLNTLYSSCHYSIFEILYMI
jgi:hypothetical protein